MKASELFKKVLKDDLKKMPYGAQTIIAEKNGINYKQLNAFLNKDDGPLSESNREKIANYLGYEYADYLKRGMEETNTLREEQTMYQNSGLAEAIEDLKAIYTSGDTMLITAIRSNLTEFRRAAEDRAKYASAIKRLEKKVTALEKKTEDPPEKKRNQSPALNAGCIKEASQK
jgi:hypothetical protein